MSKRVLELQACGTAKVDFKLLKRHTKYSRNLTEDSKLIKIFWETISNFREDDKLRLVKFCSG